MKIVYDYKKMKPLPRSVGTIGVFDGVHRGHSAVLRRAVREARRLNVKSAAITFDPHPLSVLRPHPKVPRIMSLEHRLRLIAKHGIDVALVVKFSRAFSGMTAEDFVKNIIIRKFNARSVIVGEKFSFGPGASASEATLKSLGDKSGFSVLVVKPLKADGSIISSSRIRTLIQHGDISMAARCLGRPVSVFGTVISGARLARELGYPTANIDPHHEVIPPIGVYAVIALYNKRMYGGILNIGVKPTFFDPGARKEPTIEAHIFNFKKHIYGKTIEILFIKKIRDEQKFKDPDELIRRIHSDEAIARKILNQKKTRHFI